MADFRTLDDLDVTGKRVLLRADLNVPVRDGRIIDATRVDRLKPTVGELANKGARIVFMSHFGRPRGKAEPEMSLAPLAEPLAGLLNLESIVFAPDCVGPTAEKEVAALGDGEAVLLENLRFHPGEESTDPAFARALAALGEIYVNDAFSVAHRAHASISALPGLLPAVAGRLMEAELSALIGALEGPERPVVAAVGGAKVSTKLGVLLNLTGRMDALIIGGGMANTFLHAQGVDVGRSLCERDLAERAREVMARAREAGCRVVLPTDAVVADELSPGVTSATVEVDAIPADAMILDVGPRTVESYANLLRESRTLVWNGPLGAFETKPFEAGTYAFARVAAKLSQAGKLCSVAGGGDTMAALTGAGVFDDFSYVSTAGGAFLEWLEGKELPGIAALRATG